ncbi:MAG TPA: hypothetical protein VHU84_05825 [Lacipirellulaceae bacterium]|jgi:hypothetical protein|nr:hypothetical protein [Lacipirellulaceae bacterium]
MRGDIEIGEERATDRYRRIPSGAKDNSAAGDSGDVGFGKNAKTVRDHHALKRGSYRHRSRRVAACGCFL